MYTRHVNEQLQEHDIEQPLLESVELDKEPGLDDSPVRLSAPGIQYHPVVCTWSLVVAVTCTVLNLFFWVGTAGLFRLPRSPLPLPSTYMGLADVTRNVTEEAQLHFATYPRVLTQVSSSQRDRVWPDDTKQELRKIGTISPDARRFHISSRISSIAQFRAIDYGFESCALRFNLIARNKTEVSSGTQPVPVKIWVLAQSSPINVQQLSWSTRPPRKRLLETVQLFHNGVATTESIECRWGSFPTFEISCERPEDSCLVEFWQDPKASDLGLTMVQRSSLV